MYTFIGGPFDGKTIDLDTSKFPEIKPGYSMKFENEEVGNRVWYRVQDDEMALFMYMERIDGTDGSLSEHPRM